MHFQQSQEWKKIKEAVGNKTYEFEGGWFQTTKLPLINKVVGYVPPIDINKINFEDLYKIAKAANCIYVTIDPIQTSKEQVAIHSSNYKFDKAKPVRLQKNVIIDLTKPEEELLEDIKRKVKYNIRYAEKHRVKVSFSKTEKDFENFLKLFLETKERQKFYGRGENYLRKVWQILREREKETKEQSFKGDSIPTDLVIHEEKKDEQHLDVHIVLANYENEALASMMLFTYEDTVYYPYGGSSLKHSNLKPTYLIMWESIKWAKQNGYKYFDFMGLEEDESEGFSAFKVQFGGEVINYQDSINLIINPLLYKLTKLGMLLREKVGFIKELT